MPAGAKKPDYGPYVEHVPPSDVACIFWLKNRRPDLWRDTHQLEHTLGKYHISDKPMSEEEWIDAEAQDNHGKGGGLVDGKLIREFPLSIRVNTCGVALKA